MEFSIVIAVLAILVLGYMKWRENKIEQIELDLRKPLSGLHPDLENEWKKNRIWDFVGENSVVFGTSAFTTAQVLYHYSNIDNQVFDVFDKVYEPKVENNVQFFTKEFSEYSDGGRLGALSNLKGHVGEHCMADYLREKGHHVVLAPPNQEGWDATVDGQKVNFKSGTDSSHIDEHLRTHPDIPVITVSEHEHYYGENDNVTCLPGLSGEEIEQVTDSTMQAIENLAPNALVEEIPLIAPALAFARNLKPAFQGKNDYKSATVNAVTESVGVSGGAMAFAFVGGLFGGIPIVIAGSLLGGLIGKRWAQSKIQKELDKAVTDFQNAVFSFGEMHVEALTLKGEELKRSAEAARPEWKFVPTPSFVIKSEMASIYEQWARNCIEEARSLEKEMKQGAEKLLQKIGEVYKRGEVSYHPSMYSSEKLIEQKAQRVKEEKEKLGL